MNTNEFNFTQEITLPSQGAFNPEIPGGKVVQRCMMVADQKFLSGSKQSSSSTIHQIVQRTITSPENFDVSRLTPTDTLYLLFKLRILSYGDHYKFRARCPECGKKIDVVVDLSELPVEVLDEDYEENLIIKLPRRGDTVYTKVLTNGDTEEVNKEIKRRKKRNADDTSEYVLRIASAIDKIVLATPSEEGKTELTRSVDIERYVSSLTDLDAYAILSTRDSLSYGIVNSMETICTECGSTIELALQYSADFFRPYFIK